MDFSFYSLVASRGSLDGQMDSKEAMLKREAKVVEEQVDVECISLHRHIRITPSDTSACRSPAESQQEYLTTGKEYVEPCKIGWDKGTRGENRSVSRTGPARRVGELKQGSDPPIRAIV